uniref:Phenylethanolamine N-methyltransferase n=1 Tax=Neogobius melanostomus TaxID=47308 RepID=A0A8C6TLP5_9GOBI
TVSHLYKLRKGGGPGNFPGAGVKGTSHESFVPSTFLQNFYSPQSAGFEQKEGLVPWKLSCLHRAFTDGDISGGLLIDVGSGPTLYQVLSGCEVFSKVLLTDFLEVNRQELKSWLQGEGANFDWTPFIKYVCELEGPSEWTEKAARLREVVSDVLPIDVHRAQPMAPDALPSEGADCLVSCFCLESASPDLDTFTKALGHISKLLRPGGHLLLIGALQESFYLGGPVKIPEQGFTLIRLEVYTSPQYITDTDDISDARGCFFVKAKKD